MTVYGYGIRVPKIDPSAWVHPKADVTGKVTIGPNAYVGSGAVIRGDVGTITIGYGVAILENATLQASPASKIIIGKDVIISVAAVLHNCTIHEGAMVGMGAIISDLAIIGAGAIIAEGAVVKSRASIGPNVVAAGIPAVEIGPVSAERSQFARSISEIYHNLAAEYPQKLHEVSPEDYNWHKD